MNKKIIGPAFSFLFVAGLYSSPLLWAQGVLEEVVVTAQRREASLQDVPVAVSVFTPESIEEKSLLNVQDLQFWTPSLLIQPTPGAGTNPTINLRGQAANDPTTLTIDDAVAIYFNDVYMGRSQGAIQELFDIQSVEVLKGSQGTLYGRNTTGGAIKIATVQADPGGDVTGYTAAEVGDYESYRIEGAINLPFGPDMAVRLAARHNESDGWGKTVFFDQDSTVSKGSSNTFGRDADVVYLSYVWDASDRIQIALNGDYYNDDNAVGHVLEESGDLLTDDGLVRFSSKRKKVALNRKGFNEVENWGASLSALYEGDNWMTRVILAHRDGETKYGFDSDGTTIDLLFSDFNPEADQDTVEIQFQGLAMDERLDWLVGLFYFNETGQDDSNFAATGIPSAIIFSADHVKNESKAIFSHLIYSLTSSVELGAGLRYTEDDKELRGQNRFFGGCVYDPSSPGVSPNGCTGDFKADFDFVTWSANVNWHADESTMLYLRAGKSYRPGGLQIRATGVQYSELLDDFVDTTTPYDEESVIDYELGLKSDMLDNRLRLNAAIYRTDYTDYQMSTIVGGTSTYVFNAGDAEIDGVEAETTYLLTDKLSLNAFMSWLDMNFKDGLVESAAPEWKYGVGFNYTTDTRYGNWLASLNYSWTDEKNSSDPEFNENNRFMPEDDYFLLNGRLQLTLGDISLALIGRNLTDEEYTSQVYPQLSLVMAGFLNNDEAATAVPGGPRYLGFEARYNF